MRKDVKGNERAVKTPFASCWKVMESRKQLSLLCSVWLSAGWYLYFSKTLIPCRTQKRGELVSLSTVTLWHEYLQLPVTSNNLFPLNIPLKIAVVYLFVLAIYLKFCIRRLELHADHIVCIIIRKQTFNFYFLSLVPILNKAYPTHTILRHFNIFVHCPFNN